MEGARVRALRTAIVLVAVLWGAYPAAAVLPVVVPFEPAPSPYVVIRVPVAGQECVTMLFDTGTNRTVLDPSVAARIGMVSAQQTIVESLGGTTRAVVGEVRGIGFEGMPALSPRVALVAPLGGLQAISTRIHGIYGHDWLAGSDYVIDYGHRRIVIGPTGTVPAPAGGMRAALTWVAGRPAIAVTLRAMDVEPLTATLVIDSGADTIALFGRAAGALARSANPAHGITIDSGFGLRYVPTTRVGVTIGARERARLVQLRSDLTDREEDGLLPASLFRSVFVDTTNRVVVLDGIVGLSDSDRKMVVCARALGS